MKKFFREYRKEDYEQCEELVNQAWGFEKIFAPKALSDLAKRIYTGGSVVNSNYKIVAEVNGTVAGFIFGFNEYAKKPGKKIIFGLSILWQFIWVKSEKPKDKKELTNAINLHQKNRDKLVGRGRSEIVLFVVGEMFQRQGIGKELWAGFKEKCIEHGVSSIIVETNKLEASSFYERLGFKHMGNFDSPLHEFATKGGQACVYEYVFK
ncbi:MAG: GNAT family N-acetyltransferase [Desulfobacteraceae bacterium]|jgi:ribosomal protein S18 acetylase RimI-like enzyme